MVKLQVLRFMGIFTIMKLSIVIMCVLTLLFALTWVMVYCPSNFLSQQSLVFSSEIKDPSQDLPIDEYFDYHSKKLDEDIKSGKAIVGFAANENNKKKIKPKKIKIPMNLYGDDSFQKMVDQLDHWKEPGEKYQFLASSQNVTIYRTPRGDAGLFEYKLYAYLPDAPPDQIAEVFLDNKYRVYWDEYVTELSVVQKNEKGPDVIYFNVDFPFPLANRDYVYARETRHMNHNDEDLVVIVMHSVLEHNVPEKKSAIRVDDYHQSLAMKKVGDHGTQAFIQYYDNPKGSIPSWLVNWAAKTGVPAFLKDLQRACNGLPAYRKKHPTTQVF